MLITRSDDGYFGVRYAVSAVFGEAVASFFEAIEEHCMTEEGHTMARRTGLKQSNTIHLAQTSKIPIILKLQEVVVRGQDSLVCGKTDRYTENDEYFSPWKSVNFCRFKVISSVSYGLSGSVFRDLGRVEDVRRFAGRGCDPCTIAVFQEQRIVKGMARMPLLVSCRIDRSNRNRTGRAALAR